MGVNPWEWDTCPIQEHFKNIKLIGETLFPWVWPDREKKRKKKEKGEQKWYLLGLVPHHFAPKVCSKGVRGEVKKERRVRAWGDQEIGTGLP